VNQEEAEQSGQPGKWFKLAAQCLTHIVKAAASGRKPVCARCCIKKFPAAAGNFFKRP
jgi:hypothetical protein